MARTVLTALALVALSTLLVGCKKSTQTDGDGGDGSSSQTGKPLVGGRGSQSNKPLVGTADEHFTLKFKSYPNKGQTFVVKEIDKDTSDNKIEVNGMTKADVRTTTKDVEYELKVTKAGEGKPAEFTRTYTKASKTEANRTTKLAYDGRTFVFTLRNDDYKVTAEGRPEIAENNLATLAKAGKDSMTLFNDIMHPGKAIKVGDSWTPDTTKFIETYGEDTFGKVDLDKSKATGKLLKVYKQDNQQWGSIELVVELTIKELPGAAAKLKFSELGVVRFNFTLDRPIDGSSAAMSAKGTMTTSFKGSIEQGGKTIGIESKTEGAIERTLSEKK